MRLDRGCYMPGGASVAACALALLTLTVPAVARAQAPLAAAPAGAAAGAAADPQGLLPEPRLLERAMSFAEDSLGGDDGGRIRNGFYPEFSNMPTGAGWISLGPGYRYGLFGGRAVVDASAALSWRSYKMAQARFELPQLARGRLVLGSQARWQDLTQVTFFGTGADTPDADRSEYRMKSTNVAGYATARPVSWLAMNGRIGWLDRPSLLAPAGGFKRGNPDARAMFADDVVYAIAEQPQFVHGEVSIVADTRDHRSHPTQGGVYRGAWSHYSDRETGAFSFDRYEAEGAQFLPVAGRRLVVALHGWMVASATDAGAVVPFYLQPSLGGHNTLRAYTDYRFHDRNLVVVNAEARVALFTHVDAAAFVDAGNVAARVADLNLDKRAYGVGLRLHTRRSTVARLDVAHGDGGWDLWFRISDPLHLTRIWRRLAAIPFVP